MIKRHLYITARTRPVRQNSNAVQRHLVYVNGKKRWLQRSPFIILARLAIDHCYGYHGIEISEICPSDPESGARHVFRLRQQLKWQRVVITVKREERIVYALKEGFRVTLDGGLESFDHAQIADAIGVLKLARPRVFKQREMVKINA